MSAPEAQTLSPLDRDVRVFVYRSWMALGRPPVPAEIARTFSADLHEIEQSLERLQEAHALVLIPGSHYLWMATPFSAVPTHYEVSSGSRSWWANCIWDAVSIAPMVGDSTVVRSWCNDCGQRLDVRVTPDGIADDGHVVHFALPACDWWHDLGFT